MRSEPGNQNGTTRNTKGHERATIVTAPTGRERRRRGESNHQSLCFSRDFVIFVVSPVSYPFGGSSHEIRING
jgi:hypothetical protein